MENRLKPETTGVISKLRDANIRTLMCTGDNILTALSVARDCKIIDVNQSVIIVEAKPGEEPTFKYADNVFKFILYSGITLFFNLCHNFYAL